MRGSRQILIPNGPRPKQENGNLFPVLCLQLVFTGSVLAHGPRPESRALSTTERRNHALENLNKVCDLFIKACGRDGHWRGHFVCRGQLHPMWRRLLYSRHWFLSSWAIVALWSWTNHGKAGQSDTVPRLANVGKMLAFSGLFYLHIRNEQIMECVNSFDRHVCFIIG